jgi:fatty acid desaturase
MRSSAPESHKMPDHRAFLTALPAAEKAALTERTDRAGLIHLALHLALILGASGMIALGVPLWPLLLPVQGVALTFLFTLEHECTHRTPFRSDRLGDWVGRVCGLILILPFEWFRSFHLAHHRFTNQPGLDPELETAKPETQRAWLWHVSGLPYWIAALRLMARLCLRREGAPYLPERALPRMEREARLMAVLYAAALLSLIATPLLLWLWVIPMLIGQPALRLYLLAEHGDCPFAASMFENTRTTFTNRIVRFLAWNMPYHAEHHVFPAVPFHRLPDLHARMRSHLKVTAEGYGAFNRDYLARRRPR